MVASKRGRCALTYLHVCAYRIHPPLSRALPSLSGLIRRVLELQAIATATQKLLDALGHVVRTKSYVVRSLPARNTAVCFVRQSCPMRLPCVSAGRTRHPPQRLTGAEDIYGVGRTEA